MSRISGPVFSGLSAPCIRGRGDATNIEPSIERLKDVPPPTIRRPTTLVTGSRRCALPGLSRSQPSSTRREGQGHPRHSGNRANAPCLFLASFLASFLVPPDQRPPSSPSAAFEACEADLAEVHQVIAERAIRGGLGEPLTDSPAGLAVAPRQNLQDLPLPIGQVVCHAVRRNIAARQEPDPEGPTLLGKPGLGVTRHHAQVHDHLCY